MMLLIGIQRDLSLNLSVEPVVLLENTELKTDLVSALFRILTEL